jgi:hypothetical protein
MSHDSGLSSRDLEVLRALGRRKAECAGDPANAERRRAWYAHDAGEAGSRPLVLAEIGGVLGEVMPDSVLQCTDPWARGVEYGLRQDLYGFEVLKHDRVIEPWMQLNWKIQSSGYGVQTVQHRADNEGRLGARRWDPPIQDLDRDLDKLQPRRFTVDRAATLAEKARLEAVFDGILPTRIRGSFWWTMGMTIVAIDLIGLESLMLAMFDNPSGLHRLMAFLRDDHLGYAEWLEREGLLSLNNEADPIGSGSFGHTRDLPAVGYDGTHVRTRDLWVLLESQETVGVGPDQFEEFIFPYQRAIAERFGKCYYGCCEPVHGRWHVLERLPNLARVSISPWADQPAMAERLGRRYVFSRKPAPSAISTGTFDDAAIRADLRGTLSAARNCRVELIMKDVHTVNREPRRLARWVELAREAIAATR